MKFLKGFFKLLVGLFSIVGVIASIDFFKKVVKEFEEEIEMEKENILDDTITINREFNDVEIEEVENSDLNK